MTAKAKLPILLSILAWLPGSARATISSATADVVLGQSGFTGVGANNIDATGMSGDGGIAIDTNSQRVFISDTGNSRILVWNGIPTSNGQAADAVLGQSNFTSDACNQGLAAAGANTLCNPQGIAVDASGNLYVADYANGRVMIFSPPFTNGAAAGTILGASTGGGGSSGPPGGPPSGPGSIKVPVKPASRATYAQALASLKSRRAKAKQCGGPGEPACGGPGQEPPGGGPSLCLGLPPGAPGGGSAPTVSSNTLNNPRGLAIDASGALWVADPTGNRVVHFTPPFSAGMPADFALGQPNLVSGASNQGQGGPTANTLSNPLGVALDPSGDVWVADEGNNRVLEYAVGFSTTDPNATVVLGWSTFLSTASCILAAAENTVGTPVSVAADPSGNIWVGDGYDTRVLEFVAGSTTGANASLLLGQSSYTNSGPTLTAVSSTTIITPEAFAFDASGNLWTVDAGANRALRFPAPLSSGEGANLVLGQFSFASIEYTNSTTLDVPQGVAVDNVNGYVYVSDDEDNRVLWWHRLSGFTNGEAPDGVIGQPDFHSAAENQGQGSTPGANTLAGPTALFVDSGGNLWVCDSGNARVLRFPTTPPTIGMSANLVLGQPNFTASGPAYPPSAASLNAPSSVLVDSGGHVWVVDELDYRVLHYSPTLSSGMNADIVLGQSNFASDLEGANASEFEAPAGVALDAGGNVWVADSVGRVLRFNSPIGTGMSASLVLGQANFTSFYNAAPSASTLSSADGISFDPSGNLWVVDPADGRVEVFVPPFSTGMASSFEIGQPTFTMNNAPTPGPSSFGEPTQLAFDSSGDMWVTDASYNRVLEFQGSGTPFTAVPSTPTVCIASGPAASFNLLVPPGAFLQNLLFTLTTPPASLLPSGTQKGLLAPATPIAIDIVDNLGLQPQQPLTITVDYIPSALGGLDPTKLVIAYFQPPNGPWVPIPSTPEPSLHEVVGTVQHLTLFQLFQSAPQQGPSDTLSNVHVYPNPYKPGSGGPYDNSSLGAGVVFEGLAPNSRIRVFTLSGEEVADFSTSAGNGKALWNIRNKSGNTVASGVYIFLVTNLDDTSQKATGRFSIVK